MIATRNFWSEDSESRNCGDAGHDGECADKYRNLKYARHRRRGCCTAGEVEVGMTV
jgi:hypothetical protein